MSFRDPVWVRVPLWDQRQIADSSPSEHGQSSAMVVRNSGRPAGPGREARQLSPHTGALGWQLESVAGWM